MHALWSSLLRLPPLFFGIVGPCKHLKFGFSRGISFDLKFLFRLLSSCILASMLCFIGFVHHVSNLIRHQVLNIFHLTDFITISYLPHIGVRSVVVFVLKSAIDRSVNQVAPSKWLVLGSQLVNHVLDVFRLTRSSGVANVVVCFFYWNWWREPLCFSILLWLPRVCPLNDLLDFSILSWIGWLSWLFLNTLRDLSRWYSLNRLGASHSWL